MTFKITSLFVSSKLTWHWGNKNLIKFVECLFSHFDAFSSFKCYHLKIGYNTSYCREVLKWSSESSKSKTKLLICNNNSVLERNDINSVAPFLFSINWILYVENYLARNFRYKRLQLLYPIQQNNFQIVLGNLIFISFCMLVFCSYPLSWWCCSWILNGDLILNKVKSWVCLGRGEEFNFKVCQICMHIKGFFFFFYWSVLRALILNLASLLCLGMIWPSFWGRRTLDELPFELGYLGTMRWVKDTIPALTLNFLISVLFQ